MTYLGEIIRLVNKSHSSDFQLDKFDSDIDKLSLINKLIEYNIDNVKKRYEIYIKIKHTRIIKSKKMISTIKRL